MARRNSMTRHTYLVLSLALPLSQTAFSVQENAPLAPNQLPELDQKIKQLRICYDRFTSDQKEMRSFFSPSNTIMSTFFDYRDTLLQSINNEINDATLNNDATDSHKTSLAMDRIDSLMNEYKKSNDAMSNIINNVKKNVK